MGLRQLANRDLNHILTDDQCGFAWAIVITSPRGQRFERNGLSTDIAELIDPDTGQAVSGRLVSVALPMTQLPTDLPEGVHDSKLRPWRVQFDDIRGQSEQFAVRESNPDRSIGCQILILELYR